MVEASSVSGRACAAAKAYASRLASNTSGTPSKITSARASAAGASWRAAKPMRCITVGRWASSNAPHSAIAASEASISASASRRSASACAAGRSLTSSSHTGWPA